MAKERKQKQGQHDRSKFDVCVYWRRVKAYPPQPVLPDIEEIKGDFLTPPPPPPEEMKKKMRRSLIMENLG